jgi:hypothetical protein
MRHLYLTSTEKTILCKIWWPVCSIYETESRRKTFIALTEMEGKLMDSLCFTDPTRGQDILHIFSSKQTVEQLLIDV